MNTSSTDKENRSSDSTCSHGHHHHGHHHHGHHHHGHHHHASDNIALAFFLNLFFSIIEIIGGFLTGSFAILADAVHDIGDTTTIGLAWYLERKSKRKADNNYSYGYARFSLLASVITATILLAGSLFIITAAIPKLFDPSEPHTQGVIALAFLGVAVNGYAFFKLLGDKNHNSRMLRWHLFEDAAGWIVVLLGGVIMHYTKWYIIDPILAILLAIFISYNVLKSLGQVVKIFLQHTPEAYNREEIASLISETPGVTDVHDVHIWSLDHEKIILTCHVVKEASADEVTIKQEIKRKLSEIGSFHPTIEIEHQSEDCHQDC